MKIAIVGGGAAGRFASLMLARAGHDVMLFERDHLELAPDVESAAASAFRPTAPQIMQPHIVMARCRELLRQRLPDIYDDLLAAGVVEAPLRTQMPPSLTATAAQPGDERLTLLQTRRSTVDWVLLRAVLAEPRIRPRSGLRVIGLTAAPGQPLRVTGVRTSEGNVRTDLVIDSTGRRSPIDGWLAEIGAVTTATWRAECGVAYYSRHYRLRRTSLPPGLPTLRLVAGLDEFTVGIWPADNGAVQMAVAPLAADRRFRPLKHPDVFTAVLRTVPTHAAWLDVVDPISDVFPMAGLHNTLRRLVAGGEPVVTGLHAIGDSVCTTNPTLGRGLSLAISGAADLLDTISAHGDDLAGQAVALDALIDTHVAPFYHDQAAIDQARLMALRHTVFGAPAPDPPPDTPDRITYAQLRAAAAVDPTAFRAFWKVMGMMCPPEEVYTDSRVVARTWEVIRQRGDRPPIAQPSRGQLLHALAR